MIVFFISAGVLCLIQSGIAIEKWVDLQVDLSVDECEAFVESKCFVRYSSIFPHVVCVQILLCVVESYSLGFEEYGACGAMFLAYLFTLYDNLKLQHNPFR